MQIKTFLQHAIICSTCLVASIVWPAKPAYAVEAGVEKIRALIERGNFLMSRQQFQAAIDEYQQVLDLEPNNPYAKTNLVLAHNNWGILYFHKGELEQAKAEWDKALTIDPNDRNAKNNILVLKRRLTQLGKTMDDLSKESTAKTAAKAEEKKKEEPAAPSGVVLLTPQKKEEQPAQGESAGVVLLTPQKKQETPATATETPPDNKEAKSPEPNATAAAPVEVAKPVETPPTPIGRTKAEEEADAFRRMTSGSSGYGNSGHVSAPPISSFRPIPTGASGQPPTSFLDDFRGSATQNKPAAVEGGQTRSQSFQDAPPVQDVQHNTPTTYSQQEETTAPDEKAVRKKKHVRQPVADPVNQEWTQPSSVTSETSGGPGNVDYALTKLETKIYGQPRPQPSVLKRLERMEIDSFGHASIGSITERIDKLKKLYNVVD